MTNKLIFFLTLRQKTLMWIFPHADRPVPGLMTQCCLSLPAAPSSCNVCTLQVAYFHACGDRELEWSELLVPSRNGT